MGVVSPSDLPVISEEDRRGAEEDQSQNVGPFGAFGPLRGNSDENDEVEL